MTDKEINQRIAKVCGWRPDNRGLGWLSPHGYYAPKPDYCNDLNAIHEAEKTIADRGVNAWWIYCGNIVRSMPAIFGTETAVMATARQRAEAFLRTLGKWEEAK